MKMRLKERLTPARVAVAAGIVVALVAASTAGATHVFSDVDDSRFFAGPVEWASTNKITTGTTATTFEPDRGVTRGESVTFLKRYDDNIVQPALGDRYTKAEVDAAIAAASPTLQTVTIPATGVIPSTTSTTYAPIPVTKLDVVVPPGGSWLALITLSGETNCVQNPKAAVFCFVQAVVDPGAAVTCTDPLPVGCAGPGQVVFDSVQHGANSTDVSAWGTHSQQWAHILTPGAHTIEMQWRVDEPNAEFSLDARTLSVQLYPA